MMRRFLCLGLAGGLVLSAAAVDYTWLANPLSANWLTDANWDQGAWDETVTANKAIFGASAQTAVDVNGDVTVPSVAVSGADYAFGGTGTLTVNGSFNVAAGNTVTVNGPLAQTGELANRLVKDGDGTLVVKGDSTLGYFAIHGGTVKFDGGMHAITNVSTGAPESQQGLSLARGTLIIEGGARVQTTTNSSYAANSGVDMYVTNGVFDVWSLKYDYLNAFGDNKGNFATRKSMLTVKDEGEVIAKTFRISKAEATTYPDNQGEVNLGPGGRFVIRSFTMDEGASYKKYATMNFDGGTLVMTNTPADKTNGGAIFRFSTGDRQANQSWRNVHLYIKEGGLTIHSRGDNDSSFYKAFESGAEHDGGLRLIGNRTVYLYATNSYNGGTVITGGVWCAVNTDRSLGAVPAEPTDNVFIQSGSVYFHFGVTCDIHSNRTFRLADGISAKFGTQGAQVGRIRGAVIGEKAVLNPVSNWSGITALAPAEGITNRIGKLCVDGKLRIDSGVTLITSNCAAKVGTDCPLVIRGNSSGFTNTCGQLIIAGGLLKVPNYCYITIGNYGQLIVTNGVLDLTATRELLNGINGANVNNGCGRTVVADGGELRCAAMRISQWASMKDGLPVNSVNVQTGGVLRLNNFYIDVNANQRGLLNLDGGVVVARQSNANFLGTDNLKWRTNIIVRACAGGAIFDTTNFNISVKNSVYSGAEQDGGLTKRGTGTLTMVNTNTYNGVTRLEGGKLVFQHAEGYPGGDLEIAAAAVKGTLAAPLLTANVLAFREGKGVRVTEADALDDKTYGPMKTVATFTTPLAALPSLTLVNSDGAEWTINKQWCLQLTDGGTTLKFGPLRGTQLIVR
ncbi:MAG: hypothetical protein J6V72_06655 [Kiritimatiellae bacterium]|nr:hypothetical protein [Kiritimatiellia bacterium]